MFLRLCMSGRQGSSSPTRILAAGFLLVSTQSNAADLKLNVSYDNPQACSVAFEAETLALGALATAAATAVGFQVSCNAPFTYKLKSENGALLNGVSIASGSDAIEVLVPYKIDVSIPLQDPVGKIEDACLSEALASCNLSNSASSIAAATPATLTITPPPSGVLAAGEDRDKLTISIEPQP